MTITPFWAKTDKYDELLAHYAHMATHGYDHRAGRRISNGAYGTQEAAKFSTELGAVFRQFGVKTVLDYGAGATHWDEKMMPDGRDLLSHTGAHSYYRFEPARGVDERRICDAAVSFDVLEHFYVSDVPYVLDQIMGLAGKLVVLNVACYPANALLPTGENAHVTVRSPEWWKGAIDTVAARHPHLSTLLFASTGYGQFETFSVFSHQKAAEGEGYLR